VVPSYNRTEAADEVVPSPKLIAVGEQIPVVIDPVQTVRPIRDRELHPWIPREVLREELVEQPIEVARKWPGIADYSASKGAVAAYTRGWRVTLARACPRESSGTTSLILRSDVSCCLPSLSF
jgi:hypothetical protein